MGPALDGEETGHHGTTCKFPFRIEGKREKKNQSSPQEDAQQKKKDGGENENGGLGRYGIPYRGGRGISDPWWGYKRPRKGVQGGGNAAKSEINSEGEKKKSRTGDKRGEVRGTKKKRCKHWATESLCGGVEEKVDRGGKVEIPGSST